MGRIAGIQIKNYGSLKNIKLGKLLGDNSGRELTNMNAIIGQSGTDVYKRQAILSYYGSEVNGLVNSIAQFLQVIAFLELGVGAVVQSALYKPLAVRNEEQISKIMVSGNSFFKKIAYALTVYVILLVIIYPRLVDNKFGYVYDITLIISMSISYFAQYYFGLIDSLLISADQREYIKNIIYTVTLVRCV